MTTLLAREIRWPMPRVALYWRRRRARRTFVTTRVVQVRTSPVTRISVHQHVLRVRHSMVVLSHAGTTTHRVTRIAAPARVGERIVVRRLLEARPLDASPRPTPHLHPALAGMARSAPIATTVSRPGASVAPDSPRGDVMPGGAGREGAVESRRERSVETRRVLTERARQELTQLTGSTRAADRWVRHRVDAARLEWRTPSMSLTARVAQAAARATAVVEPGRSPGATVSPASPAASGTAVATPAARGSVATLAPALDRAALDRLADHVMQRIERRVRIERERRGL